MKDVTRERLVWRTALITVGVAMFVMGVFRGEAPEVLGKAVLVCMECVGIG
jgi:hypothetical protein